MGWYMHPNKWDFYSLSVDPTGYYADPFVHPHIPDYSKHDPIDDASPHSVAGAKNGRRQRVVWVHEDAALAEVLEAAKKRARK